MNDHQLGASLRHLQLGDAALANFYGVNTGLRQSLGACTASATLEYEWRQYSREGYFSAQVPWLGGGLHCRSGAHQWLLAARVGRDDPQGARQSVKPAASVSCRGDVGEEGHRQKNQTGNAAEDQSHDRGGGRPEDDDQACADLPESAKQIDQSCPSSRGKLVVHCLIEADDERSGDQEVAHARHE